MANAIVVNSIEDEHRQKYAYDNILSGLLPFIYKRFLTSHEKYSDEGYISKQQNSRWVAYRIEELFYELLNIQIENAILKGLSLDCEDEQKIIDTFKSADADLYLELLEYVKAKGLPAVSFLKLVRIKRQRCLYNHAVILPSILASTTENLARINGLLSNNKISAYVVNSNQIFGVDHFEKLFEYLKKEA